MLFRSRAFSCSRAALENARIEAERNAERFSFLKWSAKSFDNVQIVPPGVGICHQLNIERFCQVAITGSVQAPVMYFDSLVGTDSHTTTANGMGVLGWGVGGIEAEAAALGQPITMLVPPVVGVRLTGSLSAGVTAMDLALTFAERLRSVGVVGDFRTYDYTIALRAVRTSDFMTCEYAPIPHKTLGAVALRIVNEVPGAGRVVYDITGKPPATVEWE